MMDEARVKQILSTIQANHRRVEWKVEGVHGSFITSGLILLEDVEDLPVARFRIEYNERDVETHVMERQLARWWYVDRTFTTEAVIKAAWLALRTSDEHRQREGFVVNGQRIFNPHKPLGENLE